jgi:cobalamin biosynthesis protein CobD/CbiB
VKGKEDTMDHFERIYKSKSENRHYDEHDLSYREPYHDSHPLGMVRTLMRRIFHNKTSVVIVSGILVVLVVVVVALIVMVLPLAYQFISSIEQTGIKGILDTMLPFIKKLWEGTGSG